MIAEEFVMLVIAYKVSKYKLFVQIIVSGIPVMQALKESVRNAIGTIVVISEEISSFQDVFS